jgi:deoxyribonuclease V
MRRYKTASYPVALPANATKISKWEPTTRSGMLKWMQADREADGDLFVATDVHYLPSGGARAAAVVSADAAFSRLTADRIELVPQVEPYRPGQFYLRELPPLHAVLDGVGAMTLLVVDGYADLDPDGSPGLGTRAAAEFGVPVIGVAKTAFRTATHAIPVLRGASARPLYVTAAGMPRDEAAALVRRMAGANRMPTALRRVDALARHGLPPAPGSSFADPSSPGWPGDGGSRPSACR